MTPLMNITALGMALAVLITLAAGINQFLSQRAAAARWGAMAILAIGIDLLCYLCLWRNLFPGQGRLIVVAQVCAFLLLDLSYLMFMLHFSGHTALLNRYTLGVSIAIPLTCVGLLLTQWKQLPAGLSAPGAAFALHSSWGDLLSLASAVFYGYSILTGGLVWVLLLSMLDNATTYYRRTVLGILLVTMLTQVCVILEYRGVYLLTQVSALQLGGMLAAIPVFAFAFVWKISYTIPIGRQLLLDSLSEGYLIIDQGERVVDFNPALQRLLGRDTRLKLGARADEAWASSALRRLLPAGLPACGAPAAMIDGPDGLYEVTASVLEDGHHQSLGRIIRFSNRTGRERLEASLHQKTMELTRANSIIRSLGVITSSLQAEDDPLLILRSMGDALKALGLTSIAGLPEGDQDTLVICSTTIEPVIMRAIESVTKTKMIGWRMPREQFPLLYHLADSQEVQFFVEGLWNSNLVLNRQPNWLLVQLQKSMQLNRDSAIAIPLAVSGKSVGFILLWGRDLREGDLATFQLFGSQAAWLIEKANLRRADRQRMAELNHSNNLLNTLSRVSSQLVATQNSQLILDTLGSELQKMGLTCAVTLMDESLATAEIRYISLKSEWLDLVEKALHRSIIHYRIPVARWPGLRLLRSRQPVWYSNPSELFIPMFPEVPAALAYRVLQQIGLRENDHVCFLPLVSQERLVGILPVWGAALSPADDAALIIFSNQVAGILTSAGDFEKEIQRTSELTRLNDLLLSLSEVATRIIKTADMTRLMDLLGNELKKVDIQCMVGLFDETKQNMRVEYVSVAREMQGKYPLFRELWPDEVNIPRRLWPTDRAVTEKKPTWDQNLMDKVRTMLPFIPETVLEAGLKMIGAQFNQPSCYLPMIVEDNVIGILAVWGPGLKESDLPALSTFANQLAISLENGRLFNQAQVEIAERIGAEKQMRAMLEEKDVLLKEIHHRVKNNLQVVSSLLSLQAGQLKDTEMKTILRESQNRVRSMALIHEKLYQSDNLAQVDFELYLRSLVYSLAQNYQVQSSRLELTIQAEKVFLDIDTAIPCGLIVNELVSNSLKYAFPGGRSGTISVLCSHAPHGRRYAHILTVGDDGVGLPEGFEIDACDSLGLKLVTSLVTQVEGELKVENHHGTRFILQF
jgi:two-component sensor histidine kinase